jgi:hypothetical protein
MYDTVTGSLSNLDPECFAKALFEFIDRFCNTFNEFYGFKPEVRDVRLVVPNYPSGVSFARREGVPIYGTYNPIHMEMRPKWRRLIRDYKGAMPLRAWEKLCKGLRNSEKYVGLARHRYSQAQCLYKGVVREGLSKLKCYPDDDVVVISDYRLVSMWMRS